MSSPSQPIDRIVGLRVRMARKRAGMSQTALAQRCGITFQQIQKYEKGTNRIGASRLVQIAEALGAPPSSFFEDVPSPDLVNNDLFDKLMVPGAMQLLDAFARLPAGPRRSIVDITCFAAGIAPPADLADGD